jgi:hypothetical protein
VCNDKESLTVISLLDFFFRKLFFEEEKAAEYFIIHAYLRDLVDRRVKVKAAICVPIPSQSTAPPPVLAFFGAVEQVCIVWGRTSTQAVRRLSRGALESLAQESLSCITFFPECGLLACDAATNDQVAQSHWRLTFKHKKVFFHLCAYLPLSVFRLLCGLRLASAAGADATDCSSWPKSRAV